MNLARSTIRVFVAAVMLALPWGWLRAAETDPIARDWNFDVIRLKNGYILKGVILEETATGLRFQHVHRATGRPTVFLTASIRKADVDRVDKITEDQRESIKNRLKELDPRGEGERRRMESLTLERCDWNGKPKRGWRYDSDYFSLTSNAPEEIVRRSAVKLEQIYTAYASFLPPRYPGGKPTSIILYPAFDDYQKMLAERGWKLQNPAFFNPESNRIICGSNLLMLGDDLDATRLKHQENRAEIDKYEAEIRRLYKQQPAQMMRFLQVAEENRKRIAIAERHNDSIFDNATQRLFGILYHEAFHAYVSNFVFPAPGREINEQGPPGELPRWLNEGLAQVFETALVEAGELRVGHADKDRLLRSRELIRKGQWLPINELLGAGPRAFLVQHNDDRHASDRAYLASWAVSAYLTFDRRVLGTAKLDAFLRSVNRGDNAEEAFRQLVGQKLPQFEKELQAWLMKIPEGGSMIESIR